MRNMNYIKVVEALQSRREELSKELRGVDVAIEALNSHSSPLVRGWVSTKARPKRIMSESARRRIGAAVRKAWKVRKAKAKG